jgi:hypothetical protein
MCCVVSCDEGICNEASFRKVGWGHHWCDKKSPKYEMVMAFTVV